MVLAVCVPVSGQTAPPLEISLTRAENLAVSRAEDLSSQETRAALEKLRYDLGLRAFLPDLSVGYSDNDSVVIDSADTFDKQLYLTLKETVFDGGKTFRDRTLAELSLEQSLRSLEIARQQKREAVWELYKNLSLAQQKYGVLKQGYEQALQQEKITLARQSIGEITELDVLDVQVQVDQLSDQMDDTLLSVRDQRTQLRELMHVAADTPLTLTDRLDDQYNGLTLTQTASVFLRQAESLSLDYAKLLVQKRQLAAQNDALIWSWLPTIALTTTFSASGPDFPLRQPGLNVSVSLSFPAPYAPVSVSVGGGTQGDASRNRNSSTTADLFSDLSPLTAGTELAINTRDLDQKIQTWKQSVLDQSQDFLEGHTIRQHKLRTLRETLDLEQRRQRLMEARLKIGEIKPADLVTQQAKVLSAAIAVWNAVVDLSLQERRFEALLGLPEGGLSLQQGASS